MPLSPAAAAKIAGVSRSLISREIKSGALQAVRKNNGHQSINEADLDDWMSRRTERADAPDTAPKTSHTPAPEVEAITGELAAMRETVARLEGRAETTEARIADLVSDRDAWRAQAERLASESRPVVPVSIWARLFGR